MSWFQNQYLAIIEELLLVKELPNIKNVGIFPNIRSLKNIEIKM